MAAADGRGDGADVGLAAMTMADRSGKAVARAATTLDIVKNAREAGIDQHDPLWPFVEALCRTTADISGTSTAIRKAGAEVVQEIRRAHGRLNVQERTVFRALVQQTAQRAAMRWTAIAVSVLVSGQVGFWLGHATSTSAERSVSSFHRAGLNAFEDERLLQIRSWNDINGMLDACHPEVDDRDEGKPRRYCRIPLYIEPRGGGGP